uniref:Uncharacterized protein n=1 Tax=Glossina pallidipes TaxID=7398 RepID=A0A1B0A363_GLOPL
MRDSPEVLPDPFKRSTRIQRSPEQLGGKTTQERSQSSPPILQDKSLMIKKGENSYVELGEKIGELIEMMAPTPSAPARRTIHQPMKDLASILHRTYEACSCNTPFSIGQLYTSLMRHSAIFPWDSFNKFRCDDAGDRHCVDIDALFLCYLSDLAFEIMKVPCRQEKAQNRAIIVPKPGSPETSRSLRQLKGFDYLWTPAVELKKKGPVASRCINRLVNCRIVRLVSS